MATAAAGTIAEEFNFVVQHRSNEPRGLHGNVLGFVVAEVPMAKLANAYREFIPLVIDNEGTDVWVLGREGQDLVAFRMQYVGLTRHHRGQLSKQSLT